MDVVLLGPFRIMILVLCFFLIHQLIIRQELKNYNLDYVMKRGILAGSTIITLLFILIMTKIYDTLSILLVFFLFFIWQYLQINSLKNLNKIIARKRVGFLVGVFKFIESDWTKKGLLLRIRTLIIPRKINYLLFTAVFASFACMFSRYQFLKNDLWVLSGLWLNKLHSVKELNNNQWFSSSLTVPGEQAAVNFYAKVINISEEMALHSFGLIETFCLTMVLFWVIGKLTHSKFMAPSISILVFGFFYKFLPININLLLEHNPVYLALCFVFPAMLFTLRPRILSTRKKQYIQFLILIYFATAIVNLFVFIWVLPMFFLIAFVVTINEKRKFIQWSVLAYVIVVVLISSIYLIMGLITNKPFISFLKENLIVVDMYTYFPQLIMSLPKLLNVYFILGVTIFLLTVPLYFRKKTKWQSMIVFGLFYNAYLMIRYTGWEWLDMDLYYQVLTPMIIINIGLLLGVLREYLKFMLPKKRKIRYGITAFISSVLLIVAINFNGLTSQEFEQKEPLKTGVLMAYNMLSNDYLPFSYAVVNANYGFQISKSEHSFISYEFFVQDYLTNDTKYHSLKNNKEFLIQNPEVVLPSNVFVFFAKEQTIGRSAFLNTPLKLKKPIIDILSTLKIRGRQIDVFYEDDGLIVYQIINKENASKLDELIFSL